MLINFDEQMSDQEKLNVLLAYHTVSDNFVYEEDDIPMLVMALNQTDIAEVKIDDDGAMDISYYGDNWQNQVEYREE